MLDIIAAHPFLSRISYGNYEFIGLIINQDQHVTSFYDYNALSSNLDRMAFLSAGELWWNETNRQIPIIMICRKLVERFDYAVKTTITKDTIIVDGHITNISRITENRAKQKDVRLIRKLK
jgi:hypothetical protein